MQTTSKKERRGKREYKQPSKLQSTPMFSDNSPHSRITVYDSKGVDRYLRALAREKDERERAA